MNKYIVIGTAAILILILIHYINKESFVNKQDKAKNIYDWFRNIRVVPTYTKYKYDMNGASNIVEYEDALQLFQTNKLDIDSIKKVI